MTTLEQVGERWTTQIENVHDRWCGLAPRDLRVQAEHISPSSRRGISIASDTTWLVQENIQHWSFPRFSGNPLLERVSAGKWSWICLCSVSLRLSCDWGVNNEIFVWLQLLIRAASPSFGKLTLLILLSISKLEHSRDAQVACRSTLVRPRQWSFIRHAAKLAGTR